jgi:hypothetical protein
MGSKRDRDSLAYSENDGDASVSNKRQRNMSNSNSKQSYSLPGTDPTYGQRCMFPGLDEAVVPTDDDLEYEDEGDALDYLRSVRYASPCPNLALPSS